MMQEESYFSVAKEKIGLRLKAHWARNRVTYSGVMILGLILLFIFRASFQPLLLQVREHSFVVISLLFVLIGTGLLSRFRVSAKVLVPAVLATVFLLFVFVASGAQQYLASYFRYKTLNIVTLDRLPLTESDRIQPLNSIHIQASEKINETESVSEPDLVLVDGKQRWVMEIYPSYFGQKILDGHIKELFNVSATSASPDFSDREEVDFSTGEHLLFSKDVKHNALNALGFLGYFNYFPTNVKLIQNDRHEWVQVVSMAKYVGVFFPHIEFAGVHIIEQKAEDDSTVLNFLKRISIGLGTFIPADEIKNYPYLQGQNLYSYAASRNIAGSFKFQKGLFAPVRTYHEGDIRIPEMKGDRNEMPYVLTFNNIKNEKGLFHYFGLEPFDEHKHGLSLSIFIPADGKDDKVYIYDHAKRQESLTGASAIGIKVMESRKYYNWTKNRPVEHRPFIKEIDGKREMFWLTTISTVNNEGNLAGSIPEVVITHAASNLPIWVDSKRQDEWTATVAKELRELKVNQ